MNQTQHYIIPMKILLQVFIALLVLTVITVGVAQYDFGFLNTFIAIGVASLKAGLVGAFFMGLKYSDRLFTVCLLSSVAFVILLFLLSYVDIVTRVFQTSTL